MSYASSVQRADIQVFESMIKIKVPISENQNAMKLAKKAKQQGVKFLFAQAILKKYRDLIFWKHDRHAKKDERKSADVFARSNSNRHTPKSRLKLEDRKSRGDEFQALNHKQDRRDQIPGIDCNLIAPKDNTSQEEFKGLFTFGGNKLSKATKEEEDNDNPQDDTPQDDSEFIDYIDTANLDVEVNVDSYQNRSDFNSQELTPQLIATEKQHSDRLDSELSVSSSVGYYKKRYAKYDCGY